MIITADNARKMGSDGNYAHLVQRFNEILVEKVEYYKDTSRSLNLSFDEFGYNFHDIQFLIDAGYTVYRNSACLWWEVSW